MQAKLENGILILSPEGHVDASNASAFEADIRSAREQLPAEAVVLDCDRLDYMSSAGLRVILRLRQDLEDTCLRNVHPDLYEILETTGFTEMMQVEKAYRRVSLSGCELIGQGANGKVYRLDEENIIKVYYDSDALPIIRHERELSRAAFVLGVPTAIPYDVVAVKEGGYGSVYEMLNARTYVKVWQDGEKSLEELAAMAVELLRLIHSRQVRQSVVPSAREVALDWADYLRDFLPAEQYEKLHRLFAEVSDDRNLVHGDYHFRNLMYQDGETLLIDMDKLSYGNPIFELAAIYNAYVGFPATDPEDAERFLGIPADLCARLWRMMLSGYLGTEDEQRLRDVEEKAKLISDARLMRHVLRRNQQQTEEGRRKAAYYGAELQELLARVDSLGL